MSTYLCAYRKRHLITPKNSKKTKDTERIRLNNELEDILNSDNPNSTEKIKNLEEQILQKDLEEIEIDLKFKENFTLLEDERPSKNFLNLESNKGGYHEITILKVPNPNFNPEAEESGHNNRFYKISDQALIRDKVTGQFQSYYDLQPNLKTGRDDLMNFLKSDDDESPFNEFQSRKIPARMARKMEGKLTDHELRDALFHKMHGNSAPGLDGFTFNWFFLYFK